jgi:hypothetical protein
MPKKVFTLNDFSGGLVTDKSDRALEDNELAECTNFDVSSKGKIVASRIFKQTSLYEQNSGGAEVDPGYGLFTFSNDRLISAAGTTNIGEFIVLNGGSTEIDALEVKVTGTDTSSDWQDNIVASGGDVQLRQAFYAAEGDLFVGGENTSSALATPVSLVFHKQQPVPSADSDQSYAVWVSSTQDKAVPSDGGGTIGDAEMIIYESAGSGTDYEGATALGQDDLHWIIRPSSATGGSGASGLWTNDHDGTDYYEYAVTWLYKNDAESTMTIIQNGSDDSTTGRENAGMHGASSFEEKAVQIRCYMVNNDPVTSASNTRYGARLYTRLASENGDWYLLAEMSLEKGIKGDGETEWNPWYDGNAGDGDANNDHEKWSHPDTGDACTTGDISAPPALLTYKILNGFSSDEKPSSGLAKFKTGLIANSRAYIGNVEINGRPYGDRILKSPVFQYDVFTEDSYLDVAINDGDQVTALAAHGDRILQFKNSAVYIINVSKELEFLEDEQQGAGVAFQAAVTTTPFGVVWVNTNGCYLYNGEKISQLQLGKISSDEWYKADDSRVTSLATIGYDSAHQQVIVLWDSSAETTAYVFDAETGGWHKVTDMVDTTKNTTNMVNARGDKLLVGGGATVNDVNFLADRTGAASGFSLKTKVFDLGNPESKKNLLEVAVVYRFGHADLDVIINTWDDGGTKTATTVGAISVDDTNPDTAQFDTSGTAALQGNKVYQVEISGTSNENVEITSISLVYRDLGVH